MSVAIVKDHIHSPTREYNNNNIPNKPIQLITLCYGTLYTQEKIHKQNYFGFVRMSGRGLKSIWGG
jgi:hypothetical protein